MYQERRSGHLLEKVSLAYVFLPCFIFLLGWLRPLAGVPFAAVLAFGLHRSFRMLGDAPDTETPDEPISAGLWKILNHATIAALVIFVVVYSGIGGFASQVPDYAMKHNSFLKDFMAFSWPVGYAPRGSSAHGPLVTYFAFYLPCALVGKVFGWYAANLCSLLWACLGVYLCVSWFLRIVGSSSIFFALLFLFFGGLDIIGWILFHKSFYPIKSHLALDFWMGHAAWADPGLRGQSAEYRFYFFSNMTMIYRCIHHLLPGGIIALMTYCQAMRRRSAENAFFLWSALPTGSVLVALGMIPFVLVSAIETRGRKLFSWQNLVAGPMLTLVSWLFFKSNNANYPSGWLWSFHGLTTAWLFLLTFFLIEFGVYIAFCPPQLTNPGTRPGRLWLYTAIATLVFFALYRLGVYNDLAAKAAIPSLLLIQVYIAATIRNAATGGEKYAARLLVFLLLIGACSALNEVSRGLETPLRFSPPAYESIRSVTELPQQAVAAQLFGNPDAFFWKYLAKPVQYH